MAAVPYCLTPLLPYSPKLLLLAGDRLGRALAGARIGMRALAANRQRAAMTQAAIAAEVHEPLDVHRHFAAQIALDLVVAVDRLADLQHFRVGQLVDAALGRDADLVDDLLGEALANAVNVLKRNDDALVGRNVDAGYTSHVLLFSMWAGQAGAIKVAPRPVEAGPCGSFQFKAAALPLRASKPHA
ncbi:hypothetical protein BQ8794_210025 [Mesorhizobium prunaredense]|uniref:Uncharacterized protein n=1 Tax=Mesorhizobium prunaredense TaxID=1631249 RepID=A0A1R3V628_9HYPH|nr:hypothetical protein BQ8794_210025 [Mesorhizobium prunaredense]